MSLSNLLGALRPNQSLGHWSKTVLRECWNSLSVNMAFPKESARTRTLDPSRKNTLPSDSVSNPIAQNRYRIYIFGIFLILHFYLKYTITCWKFFIPPIEIQDFFKCFVPPILKCFFLCFVGFVPPNMVYQNVSNPLRGTRKMFRSPVKNTQAGYAGLNTPLGWGEEKKSHSKAKIRRN